MARKTKPGLDYFPFDVDFFDDPKVELISSEFETKGDSIMIRLMCRIYRNGYYLPWNKDQSLLFAKRVGSSVTGALVEEVVQGLIRRSFFDKGVYDSFEILTSKGIQTRYIDAKERAKEVVFLKEYQLIDDNVLNKWNNVVIKSINEGNNPQRKEKEIREEEIKEKKTNGVAPAKPSPPKLLVNKTEEETDPYWQELVDVWFDFHKTNKLDKPSFAGKDPKTFKQLIGLLKKRAASRNQEWTTKIACGSLNYFLSLAFKEDWLSKHFLLENLVKQFDAVYQRSLLEKQQKNNQALATTAPKTFNDEMRYLISRYEEKQLDERLINPEYFDKLQVYNLIPVGTLDQQPGDTIDDKKRAGVLEFIKTNSNATV